jgi:hypothetical protein
MTSMLPATAQSLSVLYDQDYCLWLETTANLLKNERFCVLDIPNLLEEIEDIGRSERRALYSNLKIVLMHLLKSKYQPEKLTNSWTVTIVEHRQRLKKALKESPSLNPYLNEILQDCYQDARELAAAETGLDINRFPSESPFTAVEILE